MLVFFLFSLENKILFSKADKHLPNSFILCRRYINCVCATEMHAAEIVSFKTRSVQKRPGIISGKEKMKNECETLICDPNTPTKTTTTLPII